MSEWGRSRPGAENTGTAYGRRDHNQAIARRRRSERRRASAELSRLLAGDVSGRRYLPGEYHPAAAAARRAHLAADGEYLWQSTRFAVAICVAVQRGASVAEVRELVTRGSAWLEGRAEQLGVVA